MILALSLYEKTDFLNGSGSFCAVARQLWWRQTLSGRRTDGARRIFRRVKDLPQDIQ